MSGTEVERFMSTGHSLADRNNLSTQESRRQERFDASQISRINLGRMLAQVAVIPMPVSDISVFVQDGDHEMVAALRTRIEGNTLVLEGEIPFKPGSASGVFGNGNVFIGGMVSGNVSINGGSVSFSSSGGNGDTIVLNGREVDLSRSIQLVLVVPTTMNIKVGDLLGVVGITDYLDGTLDFSPSIRAELVASSVRSLIGDLSGSGKVTLDSVTEDADLVVSGSGVFYIGNVGGNVEAKIPGSGKVIVASGASKKFRASVSGSGKVSHGGTIKGDARMRVSGSGKINVTSVLGDVDQSISGSGSVTANGQTHRPRRHW